MYQSVCECECVCVRESAWACVSSGLSVNKSHTKRCHVCKVGTIENNLGAAVPMKICRIWSGIPMTS